MGMRATIGRLGAAAGLSNQSVDGLFAYYTAKMVVVRDFRLGLIFYSACFLCILYLAYSIFADQGYMQFTPIIGSVRIDLVGHASNLLSTDDYKYCPHDNSAAVKATYSSNITGHLDEVDSDGDPVDLGIGCIFMDDHDLVFPPHEEGAMFATTRLTEKRQMRMYPPGAKRCDSKLWHTEASRTNYVVGIEEYNVTIEHSLYLPESVGFFHGSSAEMDGVFVNHRGEVFAHVPRGQHSTIALSALLAAANVSLDERPVFTDDVARSALTHAGRHDPRTVTNRDLGVVLVIVIDYSNTYQTLRPARMPRYRIEVFQLPNHEFTVNEVTYMGFDNARLLRHRQGVRVVAYQKGRVGFFSLQALLLNIASGLVIIRTAKLTVDLLAIYVLPERKRYFRYIYEQTELVSLVREKELRHKTNVLANMMHRAFVSTSHSEGYRRFHDEHRRRRRSGKPTMFQSMVWPVLDLVERADWRARRRVHETWAATLIQAAFRGNRVRVDCGPRLSLVRQQTSLRASLDRELSGLGRGHGDSVDAERASSAELTGTSSGGTARPRQQHFLDGIYRL